MSEFETLGENLTVRQQVKIDDSPEVIAGLLENIRPREQKYIKTLRDGLAQKPSILSVILDSEPDLASGTPSYLAAYYIYETNRAFLGTEALGLMKETDLHQQQIGAAIFDLSWGFRAVVVPIMVANGVYNQIAEIATEHAGPVLEEAGLQVDPASLVAAGMEGWAEWRYLFRKDSTGDQLIDDIITRIGNGKDLLPADAMIRQLVLFGAESARGIYQEVKAEADILLQ